MNKLFESLRFRVRERLARRIRVFDGDYWLTFRCETSIETWRAISLQTKESGTVAWIRREVLPGDVFLDVGANIGLYTIMAAKRVGPSGAVYAFEPHVGNAMNLLRNCTLNNVADIVTVVTSPLDQSDGFSPFYYQTWLPGSSMSQLGTKLDDKGDSFVPAFSELKYGVTLDSLVDREILRPPTLIKIDVDGNESRVLVGMQKTLNSATPRSIQVEVGPRNASGVKAVLSDAGYTATERHDTDAGTRKIAAGASPDSIAHNVIFKPALAVAANRVETTTPS
jgi:FkbM family methyltransferase